MTINYGWFAEYNDVTPLENEISGLGQGTSLKVTAKYKGSFPTRFFANGANSYITVDLESGGVDVKKGTGDVTPFFNIGTTATEPHSIEVIFGTNPDSGLPGFNLIRDGADLGWRDADGGNSDPWTIKALASDVSGGSGGMSSRSVVKDGTGAIIADWNGNYVLNAAGDDFILRTAANNNPSLAESGFEFKMYDTTSVSGNHVNLPASTTWAYVSATVFPEQMLTGSTYSAKVTSGFNLSRLKFGDYEIPFTYDAPTNTFTFTTPDLGTSTEFNKFGIIDITMYDDVNNVESSGTTDWAPAPPYVYFNLRGDPDTTMMSNAYYQWQDPPVTTDQPVFDPTHYSISQSDENGDPLFAFHGRLEIEPDAPKDFSVNEYIIDNNGIQGFTRTSAARGLPVAIIQTNSATIFENTTLQLDATVSDYDTLKWSSINGATFSDDTIANPIVTFNDPGAEEIILEATNAQGKTTTSRVFNVQLLNTPPEADAGTDQIVGSSTLITMSGTLSDIDGVPVTGEWTVQSKPDGVDVVLGDTSDPNMEWTTPFMLSQGDIVLAWTPFDGEKYGEPDTVTITVTKAPNTKPTADAGPNQSVASGELVTMAGTLDDANNDTVTGQWSVIAKPDDVDVVLGDTSDPAMEWTAPVVPIASNIVLAWTPYDGQLYGEKSFVTITVAAKVQTKPTANAGPDQSVASGNIVTMAGTLDDADGDTVTGQWSVISKPPGVTVELGDDKSDPDMQWTAPTVIDDANIILAWTPFDGKQYGVPSTVTITVQGESNAKPIGNAGPYQEVSGGDTVTMAATLSDEDSNTLSGTWSIVSKPSGVNITLGDINSPNMQWVAPIVEYDSNIVLGWRPFDGKEYGDTSTVTIGVKAFVVPVESTLNVSITQGFAPEGNYQVRLFTNVFDERSQVLNELVSITGPDLSIFIDGQDVGTTLYGFAIHPLHGGFPIKGVTE